MPLQSSAHIGRVIRDGVAFNARNWPGGGMSADSLVQAVQDLFALLEQRKVAYILVGGVALLHYVEGRNTQDINLLMSPAALKKLPELQVSSQDVYFARANYGELQIDILLTKNPLFKQVQRKYTGVQRFMERDIPLATVEGLLLLKLYALPSLYRQGNFARVGIYENDIATLLHDYRPEMPALLDELAHYLNESDLAEIRRILADVQQRIQRFSENHKA